MKIEWIGLLNLFYFLCKTHKVTSTLTTDLSNNHLNHLSQRFLETIPISVNNRTSDKIYNNCESYLKAYGLHSSRFISCSIEKARPFRLCEGCIVHYQRAVQIFEDIHSNDEQKDGCRALLLDSDRVAVLNQINNNIKAIWTDADCYNCFENITEDKNATVKYSLKESTKKFLELYKNITRCINWNENLTHPENTKHNDTVCDVCLQSYTDINSHFKQLMTTTSHHVCMDLVDMMNYTRLQWGKTLDCSQHIPADIPIILMGSLLALLPIFFYCCSWYFGGTKKKTLLKQKRMSAKRLQSIYGTYDDTETDGLIPSERSGSSDR